MTYNSFLKINDTTTHEDVYININHIVMIRPHESGTDAKTIVHIDNGTTITTTITLDGWRTILNDNLRYIK